MDGTSTTLALSACDGWTNVLRASAAATLDPTERRPARRTALLDSLESIVDDSDKTEIGGNKAASGRLRLVVVVYQIVHVERLRCCSVMPRLMRTPPAPYMASPTCRKELRQLPTHLITAHLISSYLIVSRILSSTPPRVATDQDLLTDSPSLLLFATTLNLANTLKISSALLSQHCNSVASAVIRFS